MTSRPQRETNDPPSAFTEMFLEFIFTDLCRLYGIVVRYTEIFFHNNLFILARYPRLTFLHLFLACISLEDEVPNLFFGGCSNSKELIKNSSGENLWKL